MNLSKPTLNLKRPTLNLVKSSTVSPVKMDTDPATGKSGYYARALAVAKSTKKNVV